jgi:hypothetical protein
MTRLVPSHMTGHASAASGNLYDATLVGFHSGQLLHSM